MLAHRGSGKPHSLPRVAAPSARKSPAIAPKWLRDPYSSFGAIHAEPRQTRNLARTPDMIRPSIGLAETASAAARPVAGGDLVGPVSLPAISSIAKVIHDAPDLGALIPAQETSGCAAREIRRHATTHSALGGRSVRPCMDVFPTRRDEHLHVISVRGDVDLATAGDLLLQLRLPAGPASGPILLDLSETTFMNCAGLRAACLRPVRGVGRRQRARDRRILPGRPAVRAGVCERTPRRSRPARTRSPPPLTAHTRRPEAWAIAGT